MPLHAPDEVQERRRLRAIAAVEEVAPRRGVDDRMVHVHGGARLVLDRLGHEGRVAVVAQRGLPDQALEVEDLVGQLHRAAVAQVHLDLSRAALLQDAVDLQPHGLREVVDVVDDLAVFVDGGHRIGLPRRRPPPRPPHRRQHGMRRVDVARDEVELHLGGYDRLPAPRLVEGDDALEHVAGGRRDRRALLVGHVVDHLHRVVRRPWRGAGGAEIGRQHHVRLEERGVAVVGPIPGDRLLEDRVGKVEPRLLRELLRRASPCPARCRTCRRRCTPPRPAGDPSGRCGRGRGPAQASQGRTSATPVRKKRAMASPRAGLSVGTAVSARARSIISSG